MTFTTKNICWTLPMSLAMEYVLSIISDGIGDKIKIIKKIKKYYVGDSIGNMTCHYLPTKLTKKIFHRQFSLKSPSKLKVLLPTITSSLFSSSFSFSFNVENNNPSLSSIFRQI